MSQLLLFIWYSSLALAGSSVMVLLFLAWRRAWNERQEKQRAQLISFIKEKLYPLLELTNDELQGRLSQNNLFTSQEKPLLGHLCVQLCHRIKGDDRQQLVQIMLSTGFNTDTLGELKHGNRDERHAATIALQYFSDRQSRQALNRALHDEDTEVCLSAAHALYNLGKLPDLDVLLEILEGRDILHRHETNQLLQRIGMSDPAQLIRVLETRDNSDEARCLIARGMGYASDFSVIDSLNELAGDPTPQVRCEALESLCRLEHPSAETTIIKALSDPDLGVQLAATRAAGETHLQTSLGALDQLLSSPNWLVRFNSARALYQLGETGRECLLSRSTIADSAGRISALILSEHGVV